jgi:hypothetical protein
MLSCNRFNRRMQQNGWLWVHHPADVSVEAIDTVPNKPVSLRW